MRGATLKTAPYTFDGMISIHAPRAGGDAGYYPFRIYPFISIHAPRAGGDLTSKEFGINQAISIHAPRAGGDSNRPRLILPLKTFQSTPPVRGATIYPYTRIFKQVISIHAPRAGGDRIVSPIP